MSSFAGILGVIVFIFGLLGLFFLGNPVVFPIVGVHLAAGAVAVFYWLFKFGLKGLGEASSAVVGRKARFGYSAGFYLIVFVALLSAVNWIAYKNNRRFDLTQEGVYSLSAQTKTVIDKLSKPLKFVAFKGQEQANEEQIKELLELYKYINPSKVSTELVDPKTKPQLAEKYEMKAGNLLYMQLGTDQDPQKSVSRINEVSEQAVTNAVLKLSRGQSKKIYFVEGHGEPSLQSEAADGIKGLALAISDENLSAESLFLGDKSEVPADAAAVLLVSPQRSIPQAEKNLLVSYANNGGRLLIFADPVASANSQAAMNSAGMTDLAEIASAFGVVISKDVVVDLVQRLFGPLALGAEIVARDFGNHPITRGLPSDGITVFNLASSLTYPESNTESANKPDYQALVKSGKNSWAERNMARLFDPQEPSADFSEAEDLKGPVTIGVAYEKSLESGDKGQDAKGQPNFEKLSRVIVFGDSDFIRNQALGSYTNRDLILNSINWMVGEEGGLDIRPRSIKASVAPLTREQLMNILSSSLVLPELLLLFGLFVWWSRRATSR